MPVQKLTLQMTVMCDTDTLDEAVNAYDGMSLTQIEHSVNYGDDIGSGIKVVSSQTILSPEAIKTALEELGNDGDFFDIAIADMADNGNEHDLSQVGNQVPLFLTNGGCEFSPGRGVQARLIELNLPYKGRGDDFFPLTDEESEYIAEDVVTALDGHTSALIGYSVLFRNIKCLAPHIEFQVDPEAASDESVVEYAKNYIEAITPRVEKFGGEVQLDRGIDNCVVVRLIVPIANAMALGSADAWKARLALLLTREDMPVYLTNQCTEAAHGTKEQFDHLGLSYGEFDGEFYPLTDEEVRFIAEDEVISLDGRQLAMIGYSALYRGQKFLMPSIEIPFGEEGDEFASQDDALRAANAFVANIGPKLAAAAGRARVDQSEDDRVVIQLLFPFETASARGDLEGWMRYLSFLITDPKAVDLDAVPQTRYEGTNYAVTVCYIGEGESGGYNPENPEDIPYVRFDAEKRVGDRWEEFEQDGSYCTGIPATAKRHIHEALARMVVSRLEADHNKDPENRHKRLLEELSWANIGKVADFMMAERHMAEPSGAAIPMADRDADRLSDANLLESFIGSELPNAEPGMGTSSVGDLDDLELVYEVDAKFLITAGAYNGIVDKQNMADLINSRGVHAGDIDRMNILEVLVANQAVARASGPA